MSRKPRIHVPGGFYHVILRGNGRNDIFFSVNDSKYFENLISEGKERFGHRIHAYCWMRNHVHMVVEVAQISLSKIIQNLSFRYTRYINNKHDKVGHLFQGRYKAILVDAENYLLELIRYIHLNPYRAKIVNQPQEYKWSSHRVYLERCKCEWLTTDYIYSYFSKNKGHAKVLYENFIFDGLEEGYRKQFSIGNIDGRILGNEEFTDDILSIEQITENSNVHMDKILENVTLKFSIDVNDLKSFNRSREFTKIRTLIGYLVYEYSNNSLSEYSRFINRDISTISAAVNKFKSELDKNSLDQKIIRVIKEELGIITK